MKLILTGSYFFDTATDTSDVDFMVQHGPKVHRVLQAMGFKKIQACTYPDSLTIGVYEKDNIHIQVVKDVKLKQKCQKIIKSFDLLKGKKKHEAKVIWNTLISILFSEN